jgi:hypothetical protein
MTDTLAALIVLRFKGPSQSSDTLRADVIESCVGMSMEYEFNLVNICETLTGTLVAFVEVSQSPSGSQLTRKHLDSLRDELATDLGCSDSSANLLTLADLVKGGA